MTESAITFEFATQDDCLERMVPSDLRQLVAERDDLKARLAEVEREHEISRDAMQALCGELEKITGIPASVGIPEPIEGYGKEPFYLRGDVRKMADRLAEVEVDAGRYRRIRTAMVTVERHLGGIRSEVWSASHEYLDEVLDEEIAAIAQEAGDER